MIMKRDFNFPYEHYDSTDGLAADDKRVIDAARQACRNSFSPYSGLRVGAAALLESGAIVTGSNQESAVFPAGICAERNLLFHHAHSNPGDRIVVMAVASEPASDRECYPCGICRQTLLDVQQRQGRPIRLIMCGATSATAVDNVSYLMPFNFEL